MEDESQGKQKWTDLKGAPLIKGLQNQLPSMLFTQLLSIYEDVS